MNDLVSIIMPCHNGEKFLTESIDSVRNQTYLDWELLIIDDNSVDNSVSIIKEFCKKDSRIKFFQNDNPQGKPFAPRNIGTKNASGRYIAFLDCDDKWLSTKLENQIKLFEDSKCAVVYSNYKKMNENSIIWKNIIIAPPSVDYKELLNGDCIGNLTGVYDTKKVGKVYQKNIYAEDYLMWLEILKNGYRAYNTNSVEAIYRVSSSSLSSNKLKSAIWNWNIYRNYLELNYFESSFHFFNYALKSFIKFLR